jgi:hypothetical protein
MKIGAAVVLAAMLATALGACKKQEPPPPLSEITVGSHRVALRLPSGWQVFVYGQRVLVKAPPLTDAEQRAIDYSGKLSFKSLGSVALHDLGPLNRMTAAGRVAETTPAFPELADRGLQLLDRDEHREIEYRKWASINGREGEEVGTWLRRTHTVPRRLLFVANDGNLFAVTSELLGGDESLEGYAVIRESLQFLPTAGGDGSRR